MTKVCSKCGVEKDVSEFYKDKHKKDGFSPSCKDCKTIYFNQNKDKMKEYRLKYYEQNKDKIIERTKEYNNQNKEKIKEYNIEYYEQNRDIISKGKKEYRQQNKDRLNEQNLKYIKKRRCIDINFKIMETLRARVRIAIKKQYGIKSYKSKELLGCTIKQARKHLESQFTEGMTWDNHGMHGWHIDHIRPCASFDLTDPEQQKECFHYTNLQPLWAEDNLSKGAKWDD